MMKAGRLKRRRSKTDEPADAPVAKRRRAGGDADQPRSGAFVLHVELKSRGRHPESVGRSAAERLEEALGLTRAIGLDITGSAVAMLQAPQPRALLGVGKVEEIAEKVREAGAELVVVNAQLSPVQQRNLERAWDAKVIDRTGLILEIFGERARTREGSLQVELAHLEYQKSRLVRSWTHLERQRGGFGFLGGPGESQLEIDRRLIGERITRIERELETVKRTRGLHRKSRSRVPYPAVALVGYTNAGKSTLFNRLTRSAVLAKDLLFATLDPTMREVTLPHGRRVILSDTVGFISELPTMLIAAFRATLEEVLSADLILHVRDISHANSDAQAEDVGQVLEELGLDDVRRHTIVEVWNKVDLVEDPAARQALESQAARRKDTVVVSSLTGEGFDRLLALIEEKLADAANIFEIELAGSEGQELAWFYENAEVLGRIDDETGPIRLHLRFDPAVAPIALNRFGDRLKRFDFHGTRAAAE